MIFRPTEAFLRYQNTPSGSRPPRWDGLAGTLAFKGIMPYVNSFGAVPTGQSLLYINSLMNVSFAINEGNFAAANHVESGPEWMVYIRLLPPGDDGKEPGE